MYQDLIKFRRKYVLIQGVALMFLFLLMYSMNLEDSITFFAFLMLWNIITYIWVSFNEIKYSKDFHPFILFAVVSLQYIGFSGYSIVMSLLSGESFYLGACKLNSIMSLGFLYLTLEHYLIFFGYYWYNNRRLKKKQNGNFSENTALSVRKDSATLYRVAMYNYVVVWGLRLLNIVFPLASLSSALSSYSNTGYLVSLSFFTYIFLNRDKKQIFHQIFWVIVLIEVFRVLGHGMKQEIITPILPYIIYLFMAYKRGIMNLYSVSFFVKCAALLFFVIGFVFPYISIFRSVANKYNTDWQEVPISYVLEEYSNSFFQEKNDEGHNGLKYFMERAGSVGSNSFSINYAQEHGINPKYFLYATSAIIPRFLWPDKPDNVTGVTAYYLALGMSLDKAYYRALRTKTATTSITLGFIGSAFWTFGIVGALFFPLLAGVASAYIWNFLKDKLTSNIIAVWLFYSLMTTIFIDYENFVDCGLIFYSWSLVYILLIRITNKKKNYV